MVNINVIHKEAIIRQLGATGLKMTGPYKSTALETIVQKQPKTNSYKIIS